MYYATVDARNSAIYAAANHYTFGPTVQRSMDGGQTWTRSKQLSLPERSGLIVNATWHIEPGRPEEPETLYLGGDPGVLFRSDNRGETWETNLGILEHPTRDQWLPGAGGLCIHSIQLDPNDPQRMYVGITGGGTFRTEDGGATWMPRNTGVAAGRAALSGLRQGDAVLRRHPRLHALWMEAPYRADGWLDPGGEPVRDRRISAGGT